MALNFDEILRDISKDELKLISKIAARGQALARELGNPIDFFTLEMDITAAHHDTPLKLQELLDADNGNFGHDVFGIRGNINRETGELENCFLPRFAAQ